MRDRHVPLEGALNLRDLGGLPTGDGGVVRRGQVFRSDHLCELTDADLDVLARLGIGSVLDLRSHGERSARPNRLWHGVEYHERTSEATGGDTRTLLEQLAEGDVPEADDTEFAGLYLELLERMAPEFRVGVELAARSHERPFLFHCTAGKDRTGILAYLLLGSVGVTDEVILDDYVLTTDLVLDALLARYADALAEHGVAPERVAPLMSARRPVLQHVITTVGDSHGGPAEFLQARCGVTADLLATLRGTLVTTSQKDA